MGIGKSLELLNRFILKSLIHTNEMRGLDIRFHVDEVGSNTDFNVERNIQESHLEVVDDKVADNGHVETSESLDSIQ